MLTSDRSAARSTASAASDSPAGSSSRCQPRRSSRRQHRRVGRPHQPRRPHRPAVAARASPRRAAVELRVRVARQPLAHRGQRRMAPAPPPARRARRPRRSYSRGRYSRPRPASSATSRSTLVSCSARPSACATSSAAGRGIAEDRAPTAARRRRRPGRNTGRAWPGPGRRWRLGVHLHAVDRPRGNPRCRSPNVAAARASTRVTGRSASPRIRPPTRSRQAAELRPLLGQVARLVGDVVDDAAERVDRHTSPCRRSGGRMRMPR